MVIMYNKFMDENDKRLEELKDYFDHILNAVSPSIKLDNEQRKAIIADDDAALIIAGAGTGKTTTKIAKVKYPVDILKVDPKKILVMSFPHESYGEFWLKDLFMHKPEHEDIEFAEERRVFYVALTRTKNQVTLLCNRASSERSRFLIEIMDMINRENYEN